MATTQQKMRSKIAKARKTQQEEKKNRIKYKRVKKDGKIYVVSSTDGGKSWTNPKLYNSKEFKTGLLGRSIKKRKNNLKVEVKSINKTDYNVATESGKKAYEKAVNESKKKKKPSYTPLEDDNDAADRHEERIFRESSSGQQAKEKHAQIAKDKANKEGRKKAKGGTTKGGPVTSGVKYARSLGDDLAGFRRGPGTGRKDTRTTKRLKEAGFTEDRLARLRKKHAEWKNKKKLKKNTGG
tara:strand:- start:1153 stop:1869 length:717 start_codon:yes stop_codon:yes gene_type:complete